MRMTGKVALISGAAGGMGAATARLFAAEGAKAVVVADILDQEGKEVVAEIGKAGGHASYLHLDVTDEAQWKAAVEETVAAHGKLDVLVNNAGISMVGPHIKDITDEVWDLSLGVMQSGVFYCMRAATKYFLPQRSGSVVNISSIRGFSSNPGRIAYCATKAAVIMMTKVAAAEWAPYGVRANAIAPGVQRTPMWDIDVELGVVDEERVLRVTPAGRLGDPKEVGKLAVFLCSDDAEFINGDCITIDGGLTTVPIEGEVTRPE